jgi:alanine racemase
VGYADGWSRLLSNRGAVLVRGRRAPIVGRVCMDLCMVDVTEFPEVEMGDEVVLLGSQGAETQDAHALASLQGTIAYEVLCAISARVPRLAVGGNGAAAPQLP